MHRTLYLVDQSAVDLLKKLESPDQEEDKPALNYSEIYDSIVKCRDSKSGDSGETLQPKLSVGTWLQYRWNGKKFAKKVIRSRRAHGVHEHKHTDKNE